MTASLTPGARDRALEAGMSELLIKPIARDALDRALGRASARTSRQGVRPPSLPARLRLDGFAVGVRAPPSRPEACPRRRRGKLDVEVDDMKRMVCMLALAQALALGGGAPAEISERSTATVFRPSCPAASRRRA